jgi:glycosyltransferase involved in cell wall biosynthesis
LAVLAQATQVKGVGQLICVDDGSSDGGPDLVGRAFPQIELVRLPWNRGKAEAVRTGLERVVYPFTLLLDADLRSLVPSEIDQAIDEMVSNRQIDMIILRRMRAAIHSKVTRGDVLYSGERILRTDDLRCALQATAIGYQIEIAINQYMLERQKQVYWMPSSALNTYKPMKSGLVSGLTKDLAMFEEMLSYHGPGAYFHQLLAFARNRAPAGEPARESRSWKNKPD